MRAPLERLAALVLSSDPKRRIRVTQNGLAILLTVPGLLILLYAAGTGLASTPVVTVWTLETLGMILIVYAAIRSGWSERLADPSMTLLQMLFSLSNCAAAYAIAGPFRGVFMPLTMVVLMFGMFALTLRQMLAISIYSVVAFGAGMALMCRLRPEAYPPAVEWAHFAMVATMLPTMSLLAGQLSRLRTRLQRQKNDLGEALARIQVLVSHDDLTGLINRRQLNELLDRELQRCLRGGASFCVAMLDLDHFKRINDTHGHGAGDEVLRAFAREAARRVRISDSLGRWGGEEFVLLMPDSALPETAKGPERLRAALEALEIDIGGGQLLKVTLSAGLVQHSGGESLASLLERADAALYRAKSEGRNRIVIG